MGLPWFTAFTCFYHISLLKVELYRLEDVYDVREVNGTRCRCCGPSSATCRIRVRRCEDRPSSLLWPSSRKPRRMRSTGGAVWYIAGEHAQNPCHLSWKAWWDIISHRSFFQSWGEQLEQPVQFSCAWSHTYFHQAKRWSLCARGLADDRICCATSDSDAADGLSFRQEGKLCENFLLSQISWRTPNHKCQYYIERIFLLYYLITILPENDGFSLIWLDLNLGIYMISKSFPPNEKVLAAWFGAITGWRDPSPTCSCLKVYWKWQVLWSSQIIDISKIDEIIELSYLSLTYFQYLSIIHLHLEGSFCVSQNSWWNAWGCVTAPCSFKTDSGPAWARTGRPSFGLSNWSMDWNDRAFRASEAAGRHLHGSDQATWARWRSSCFFNDPSKL